MHRNINLQFTCICLFRFAKWSYGILFVFYVSVFALLSTLNVKPKKKSVTIDHQTKKNNPDLVKDVCEFAKDLVCTEKKMPEFLGDVFLHLSTERPADALYNQVQNQGDDAICYAIATAAVMHQSMRTIKGREGGYPTFEELRDEMIKKYGRGGAKTVKVLREMCPKYRLEASEKAITEEEAKTAIVDKRPVLARFQYSAKYKEKMKTFFGDQPSGIMSGRYYPKQIDEEDTGHVVVLVGFDSTSLKFMNSWGEGFADAGFFRVENGEVLGIEFYDITPGKLTESEKRARDNEGPEQAAKLMSQLKAFATAKYTCPKCSATSYVTRFTGTHANVKCPVCFKTFSMEESGRDDLAMTMHLASLMKY